MEFISYALSLSPTHRAHVHINTDMELNCAFFVVLKFFYLDYSYSCLCLRFSANSLGRTSVSGVSPFDVPFPHLFWPPNMLPDK